MKLEYSNGISLESTIQASPNPALQRLCEESFATLPGLSHKANSLYNTVGYLLDRCHPVIRSGGQWGTVEDGVFSPCSRSIPREREVIGRYLATIAHARLPEIMIDGAPHPYHEAVYQLAEKCRPLNSECRIAVTVPAYNEARTIDQLLATYQAQEGIPQTNWELNVLINGPVGYQKDTTNDSVQRAKSEWDRRGLTMNILEVEFHADNANVGLARRLQHDVMALRSILRKTASGPLYYLCEDADTYRVPARCLHNVIKYFDDHPEVDAAHGFSDRGPETMSKNDLVLVERRITAFTECFYFRHCQKQRNPLVRYHEPLKPDQAWLRPATQGGNGAMTAESLALVRGGFDPIVSLEDVKLGWKLSLLRGLPTDEGVLLQTDTIRTLPFRCHSSPRRFVLAAAELASGKDTYVTPYKQFGSPEINSAIRSLDIDQMLRIPQLARVASFTILPDEEVIQLTNKILEFYRQVINHVVPVTSQNTQEYNLKRYSSFLSTWFVGANGGIVYEDGKLQLRDAPTLKKRLELNRMRYFQDHNSSGRGHPMVPST